MSLQDQLALARYGRLRLEPDFDIPSIDYDDWWHMLEDLEYEAMREDANGRKSVA